VDDCCERTRLPCFRDETAGGRTGRRGGCGLFCCGSKQANVAVGFAGYDEDPKLDAVKWFYVGLRCARCGVLCCFNDGKVGRGPAKLVSRRA
jgi:hypothetical protein